MLKSLSIANYALIEHLYINFEDGFSVITGETGAGKSIIIGALSLILGKRANPNILKDSTKKCVVEGVFEIGNMHLHNIFIANDLDYDNQTIIRREILPSGKSRAFINDTPVNLALLNSVGNKFVNIHSQHQSLLLSDSSFQLSVLDDFVNKPDLLNEYQKIYSTYNTLSQKLRKLIDQNEKAIKDEDYFNFQFEELNNASLSTKVVHELEERFQFLEHAEEIKTALSKTEAILSTDENPVIDNLITIERTLQSISHYLPNAKALTERINSVSIELKDILLEIETLNSNDEYDPMELQLVNDKLSTIYSLFQKHRVATVDELINIRKDYEVKLLKIKSLDEVIAKTKDELSEVKNNLDKKAAALHKSRIMASDKFSTSVTKVLKLLGMKDAGFNVQVEQLPSFNNMGIDKVLFLFKANLGTKAGEISKIASGGELSRLMLAIKSLINKKQMLPTVVFDEIDSGVSGEIAGKVGSILKKMALKHQVISISHLPQIASKAHHHYKVYKVINNNTTLSTITKLSNEARVEELASMLSSEKVTANTLKVARELMQQ